MNRNLPGLALFAFILVLLVPALFCNLGLVAISADEPTRAIVAMEMMHSGNYLVSTVAGEYYYKKPPLFNWILVALYSVAGSKSELITRLTAVVPLLVFAARLFFVGRRHLRKEAALLAALMFLTFGRMLYYDSMLGHIDILYGWLTFESFCLLYSRFDAQRPFWMYLSFYALHAACFMLKGLPSLIFPMCTLAAMAFHRKQYKWLFTGKHPVAACIAFLPVAVFFYAYSRQNSLAGWAEQLWDQSKQRTVLSKSLWENVRHLFLFPADHLVHLAPWSLLVVFVFRNRFTSTLKQHPFMMYLLLVLALNLPPYWASPGYYPRYLFMLYPIVFLTLGAALWEGLEKNPRDLRVTSCLIKVVMIAVTAGFIAAVAYTGQPFTDVRFFVTATLLAVCTGWGFAAPAKNIWLFTAFLLVTRIAFNLYVLPHRQANGSVDRYKAEALRLAKLTAGQPLFITTFTPVPHEYIYYLERERNRPLPVAPRCTSGLYMYRPEPGSPEAFRTITTFPIEYERSTVHLVKFLEKHQR